MSDDTRGHLIASLLEDPRDELGLLALADWHEEASLPHQAALLRLAVNLRRVPWPAEPDEASRRFWITRDWRDGHEFEAARDEAELVIGGVPGHPWRQWPRCCEGWHGAGRLPGMAAAYRLIDVKHAARLFAPCWRRLLVRCELYACGVITRRGRDAEYPTCDSMPYSDSSFENPADATALDLKALWRLRGGRAGRAVCVMIRHEVAAGDKGRREFQGQPYDAAGMEYRRRWVERRDVTLALARTYHRDLLRAFRAGEPWVHGRGVYAQRRAARERR